MNENELINAVSTIKAAVLRSQSRAIRMISGEELSLYYGIGLYVSDNSRHNVWRTAAVKKH